MFQEMLFKERLFFLFVSDGFLFSVVDSCAKLLSFFQLFRCRLRKKDIGRRAINDEKLGRRLLLSSTSFKNTLKSVPIMMIFLRRMHSISKKDTYVSSATKVI